jgi:Fic family protein
MTAYATLPKLIYERILKKKQKLNSLGRLSSGRLKKIEEQMQVDFVYNSNKIEGNTLSRGETELVMKGITIDKKNIVEALGGKSLEDIIAAQNHPNAINIVKKIAFDKSHTITENDIKKIHETAMKRVLETAGQYRQYDLSVKGAGFTPPPYYEIPKHMKELILLINNNQDELRPIELVAQVHYDFVWIHPFENGNGRMARLLMNLLLVRNGYPFTVIKNVDKPQYLRALRQMDVSSNFEQFLVFIARCVEQTLDLYLASVAGKPKQKFLTLAELARGTPHSADYWSLLARKGRIDAIKEGKTWKSTRKVIETYLKEQSQR